MSQEVSKRYAQRGVSAAKEDVHNAIKNYNHLRLHMSCGYLTPDQAHQKKTGFLKKWK